MVRNMILKGVQDVLIEKNCAWIIANSIDWLLKYDIPQKKLELVAPYPEDIGTDHNPFSKIVKLENEIYFIPQTAKDIFCYNLEKNEFNKLNAPIDPIRYSHNIQTIVKDKVLYCVERFPDSIVKIDTVSKSIKVFEFDNNPYVKKNIESEIYRLYKSLCLHNGKIIWPNYKNILTAFDIELEEFSVETLDGLSQERVERMDKNKNIKLEDWIIGVQSFQNSLWLFSFEGKIYQYNDKIRKIEKTFADNYNKDTDKLEVSVFRESVLLEDELWFIPQYKNKCVKYNSNAKQFEIVMDSYIGTWDGYERDYTVCKAVDKQKILAFSYYENCFYLLDIKQDLVHKKKLRIPIEEFIKEPAFYQSIVDNNQYRFDDLDFLWKEMQCRKRIQQENYKNSIVGKKIYESLKV